MTIVANFINHAIRYLVKMFFKELKLTRLFSSYEEQNNWFSKAFVKPYNTILSPTEEELPNLLNEFGNGSLLKSAKLDVKKIPP